MSGHAWLVLAVVSLAVGLVACALAVRALSRRVSAVTRVCHGLGASLDRRVSALEQPPGERE